MKKIQEHAGSGKPFLGIKENNSASTHTGHLVDQSHHGGVKNNFAPDSFDRGALPAAIG
jgi:hypothetical protein